MTRLPDGCSVEWTRHPTRQDRLLDWLQNHPLERQCLFNPKAGRHLTKATCLNMAAQTIFAQDENPANSVAVKADPTPFGCAIMSLIKTQWRPKYQKVNKAVGRTAARIPYTDFDPNSDAKKVAEVGMIRFPQWARLHEFWRLLPEFNQFADKGESSSRATGRKRKKTLDVEDSDEPEESDGSYFSPKPVQQPQTRVKIGPPGRGAKRVKRSLTVPTPSESLSVKSENEAPIIIDVEDDEPESSRASTSITACLTRDQQFEKDMAELRLRTKEQELRAKEQEFRALEKKHEAFMALYGPPKL
ncbi:hypothetical protein D9619_009879 [Psilocybe cf. subviscida]|uniref:Uncharacterized protein n=1 Tax=Psilocybe cf. subviscida TaxID=2480587 RepID=A0A8H5F6Z6_9AGAR|nr:hypothetical protein D9619_009879 [Psilocybe cf. subviscida]